MGSKSDYLENAVLDHIFGGGDFSRPASLFVALFTTAPTDGGGGVEVSGGSYARAEAVNNPTNWPSAAAGMKNNGTQIVFPTATADWGTIAAFAIMDASSGGNLLYWGAVAPPKVVASGDTASFPAGDIEVTED